MYGRNVIFQLSKKHIENSKLYGFKIFNIFSLNFWLFSLEFFTVYLIRQILKLCKYQYTNRKIYEKFKNLNNAQRKYFVHL